VKDVKKVLTMTKYIIHGQDRVVR